MPTHLNLPSYTLKISSTVTIVLGKNKSGRTALLNQIRRLPEFVGEVVDDALSNAHYTVVQSMMDKWQTDQVQRVITTQNPMVMDHVWLDTPVEAQNAFILARNGSFRNLTDREAILFIADYKAGIQHVSEILRCNGLW